MFVRYDDASVRATGRWGTTGWRVVNSLAATACGAKLEIAFLGEMITLKFDTLYSAHPYPHLWIRVDDGAWVEATVEKYLRVRANGAGQHLVTIVYKSAVEQHHRWHPQLVGKIAFMGYEAEGAGVLPAAERKYMEFVGDSITEGVETDYDAIIAHDYEVWQYNRPFQDDVMGTYGYLTAEMLGYEPLIMGYGASGVTRFGCGGVPKAAEAYLWNFEGSPINRPDPEIIVINHGANDREAGAEVYVSEYRGLLDVIRTKNPNAKIVALSAFCGVWPEELGKMIAEYNAEHGCDVAFIDSTGWIPIEPLHPNREGHRTVAEHLIKELKQRKIVTE